MEALAQGNTILPITGGFAIIPNGKPLNAAHAMRIVATRDEARKFLRDIALRRLHLQRAA